MKKRLFFLITYFLFWVIYFVITKIVFLLYHYRLSAELDLGTILLILVNGLKLDLSFTAYISVIPFFIISLSYYLPDSFTKYSITFYTIIILILVSVLTVIDLGLYTYWEYRLDATPLMYLKTPKEMFASVEISQIIFGIFFLAILIAVSVYLFLKLYSPPEKEKRGIGETERRKTKRFTDSPIHPFTDSVRNSGGGDLGGAGRGAGILNFITILFLTASLIIPIRGGFQLAAINQSHVYFSKNSFANHAAVNVPWNFCHSIVERSFEKTNPYNYLPEDEARVIIQKLLKTHTNGLASIHSKHPSDDSRQLTIDSFQSPVDGEQSIIINPKSKIVNPNVIIIILESFTSKLIQPLGGMEGIAPNFNKLTKEGILFTNIYASGDRSDKGLPAILSGFPAQPARSIVMIPSKTAKLPFISKIFKKNFYHTSFYYGGELEFANIKSYLINGEFDKIVGKDDFDPKDLNSKWGAHDHVVFDRLLDDLDIPQPKNGTARSVEEARKVARRIGYPILVRPSYVLGGRSMVIIFDEGSLDKYVRSAVDVSPDHPVLIDRFLEDAREYDVDALADGSRVVIGGIMEHIEEAGIHSGDSTCVLPPIVIEEEHLEIMREYTRKLGRALAVVGLMNIQFAVVEDQVYVLEVNPRAS
ncbi:MAG: sulfatase-like hydrolase/transferase, partial [Bacteroidetes bacterium]|nr:sulfatase-like hydrolase/transferase [Bacteroidota bacterium]